MRRQSLRALLAGAWTLGLGTKHGFAGEAEVWVALSEGGGAHAEAARTLQDAWGRESRLPLNWRIATWPELPATTGVLPQLLVTLGAAAFRIGAERALASPALARVPMLAALLPQAGYQALAARGGLRASAVFLDQPPERYAELLHLALPECKRVGVLFGPDSLASRAALAHALAVRGLTLVPAAVLSDDRAVYPALRSVLDDADVLLVLPDKLVFNANSMPNILIAAYRQRVPLVSYSAAHVRAGALLALHTDPDDVAQQVAAAMRQVLAGRGLPPQRLAEGFSIASNEQVARSLGLALPAPQALARLMQSRESAS